jgi:ATP-dependent DNA helicase RecG
LGPVLHGYPEDVAASRLAATMVGMANTSGGMGVLGVAPRSGQVIGVRNPAEAIDRVFQAALLADPPLVLPVPQIQPAGQAQVLVTLVPPGLPHVYSLEGRFLGREGTQTNPLPARRLRQLLLERGVIQFESRIPPGVSLEDLDSAQVTAYLQALQRPCPGGTEDENEILLRRGCIQRADGELLPTYAGLLLFGRPPQQLPNATLLAARFPGVAFSDPSSSRISTAAPRAAAPGRTVRPQKPAQRWCGWLGWRMKKREYPLDVVRELLVNGSAPGLQLQGDNVHLNLFGP